MSIHKEDQDMKIFTTSQRSLEFAEAERVVAELEHERQNGNLARARELGVRLAEEVSKIGEPGNIFGYLIGAEEGSQAAETVQQRKILLAFAIESSIAVYSPSKLIGTTILNAYYEMLSTCAKDFYDTISFAGAFSLYYLDLRRGIKVSRAIGKTFAKLCGKEGDKVYEELGYALNCRFYDTVCKLVDEADFQD